MKLNSVTSLTKILLLSIIRFYQALRFMRQPACRFYPSCSQFMHTAITKHGVIAGLMLGCMRLLKCHPLNVGGVDEVPEGVGLFNKRSLHRLHPSPRYEPAGGFDRAYGGLPSSLVPGSQKRLKGLIF